MKAFRKHVFNPTECKTQIGAFRTLLNSRSDLLENDDIRPFFEHNTQIAAFIGSYVSNIVNFDLVADQLSIFGDFTCDLAIGDSETKTFCLVEFEDATPTSIFRRNGKKATREWAPRFEHGFSQLVDWFYKLDDVKRTTQFETLFGRGAEYYGLLVVGRSNTFEGEEEERLKWRLEKVIVDSRKVFCVTFDDLCDDLENCLKRYDPAYFASR